MGRNHLAIAEAYYTAVGEKNIAGIEKYLHPDVQFSGPLAQLMGKKTVLEATKNFANMFQALTIRAKLAAENQAMIVYDVECLAPIGRVSSAALMTFENELIVKIELFYDARPFEEKKDEIFHSAAAAASDE